MPLLFASGAEIYPRFAGRVGLRGRRASRGAMAAFPVADGTRRARRFLRLALLRLPPWRWPRAWRSFHGLRPTPPASALYVDALATAEDSRRRGVAPALLEAAGAGGYAHLALETEVENAAARALYRSAGFAETDVLPAIEPSLGEGYVCLECPIAGR